jgi:hypothetical protein
LELFWIARTRPSWSPEQRVGLTKIWAESASEALLTFLAQMEFGRHDATVKHIANQVVLEKTSGAAETRVGGGYWVIAEPMHTPEPLDKAA